MPMSYLAAWAKDPAMKKRASMMLDYLIADYAAENLDGLFVGAHARTYDREVLERAATVAADFGWLLVRARSSSESDTGQLLAVLFCWQADTNRPRF